MSDFDETFTEALEFTAAVTPEAFPRLIQHFDPVWVEEALQTTGTATIRCRRLPAERTVWLMLGMAILRDLPITEVARQLEVALPGRDGSRTVAPSALVQARARLGADPMDVLFTRSGEEWGHASADRHRWCGLALYGGRDRRRGAAAGWPRRRGRRRTTPPRVRSERRGPRRPRDAPYA